MEEAERLVASGYRCISNTYRMVSRLDRADWREHMGREHTKGFRGDPRKNLEEGMRWVGLLGPGAADHYRRVLSSDRISNVSPDVYAAVKKGGQALAAREGDEFRQRIPG